MAPQWSSSEMTALLRAWREDVDTPTTLSILEHQKQQQHTHTLFQRFVALCGGHSQRTEVSVLARRDTLRHMWTLISKFQSEQQQQQPSWFALPEWEKRLVLAKQSQAKSYSLLDISRATYLEVDQIMAARRRQIEREQKRAAMLASQSLRVVSDTEVSYQVNSVLEKTAGVAADSSTIVNKEHRAVCRSKSRQGDPPIDDSGSSTESDEDFIIVDEPPTPPQRSPLREQQRQEPVAQLNKPSPLSRPRETFEPRSAACRSSDNGWRPIFTHKNNKRLKPTTTSPGLAKPVRMRSVQISRTRGEATKSTEPAVPSVGQDGVEMRRIADDLNARLKKERLVNSPVRKQVSKIAPTSLREALTKSPRSPKAPASSLKDRVGASTSASAVTTTSGVTKVSVPAPSGAKRQEITEARYPKDLNTWVETERLANSSSQKPIVKYMVASMRGVLNPSPRSSEPAPTAEASVLKHTTELKVADTIKSLLSPDTLHPVPPPRASGRKEFSDDIADRLNIQANELRSVFAAFRKMNESNAALTNQFFEEVQRDMADRERVREQVRQLEDSIEREKFKWALEKAQLRQDWEELQRRLEQSED